MSRPETRLPLGFEALEPFVEAWAAASAAERAGLRGASAEQDRVSFYAVGKALAPAALAHLDEKPLDQLDPSEQRLMNLMLSLCHVSLAVELQGQAEPAHARLRELMPITRTSAGPAAHG